jgi:glycosyltransferase involved in cell wall biosynthesis
MRSFVSVIIPVFNDSARLTQALRALESQSYAKAHYEVIA